VGGVSRCRELLTEQGGHKADAAAENRSTRHIQGRQHGESERGQADDVQQLKERDLISGAYQSISAWVRVARFVGHKLNLMWVEQFKGLPSLGVINSPDFFVYFLSSTSIVKVFKI